MTILGIVLVTIAKLALDAASAGRTNDLVATRTAALQQQAARLGAIPYTYLSTMTSSTGTVTVGGKTYTRKITLSAASKYTTVTLVMTPTSATTKPDSVVFTRASNSSGSPLCVGC